MEASRARSARPAPLHLAPFRPVPFRLASLHLGVMVCLAALGLLAGPCLAAAAPRGGDGGGAVWSGAGPGVRLSAMAVFHSFTGEEMEDAYGQMYGGLFQVGWWTPPRLTWRLETGLLLALGDPRFPDPTWEVGSSEMQALVLPLGGSLLYRFAGDGGGGFQPYVGIGPEGYFGFERTSVEMTHLSWGTFDWNDTQYRATFAGHACLGASFAAGERLRGLVELRWTQGLDGSDVEQSFSPEEVAEGWLAAAAAVQRPDFNFTGWSLDLGVSW